MYLLYDFNYQLPLLVLFIHLNTKFCTSVTVHVRIWNMYHQYLLLSSNSEINCFPELFNIFRIMTSTVQATKNAVTLKGSAKMVSEFFHYGINSILYQRGIYPSESFTRYLDIVHYSGSVKKLGRCQSPARSPANFYSLKGFPLLDFPGEFAVQFN